MPTMFRPRPRRARSTCAASLGALSCLLAPGAIAAPPTGGCAFEALFPAPVQLASEADALIVADFTGDGRPDLLLTLLDADAPRYVVYPSRADGALGDPVESDPGRVAAPVATGDFNADGLLDLVGVTSDHFEPEIVVAFGDGAGGFAHALALPALRSTTAPVVADFTGDMRPDLLAAAPFSNALQLFPGDGAGGFAPPTLIAVGSGPDNLLVEDFNNDALPDIAFVNRSTGTPLEGTLSVRFNDGAGGFVGGSDIPVGPSFGAPRLGDIDADGLADIVSTSSPSVNADHAIVWLRGLGGGAFAPQQVIPTDAEPRNIQLAELDGMPGLEIVYTSAFDGVRLAGPAGERPESPLALDLGFIEQLAFADFVDDALSELVTLGDAGVLLTRPIKPLTYSPPPIAPTGDAGPTRQIVAGDFNRDGADDLAFVTGFSPDTALFYSLALGDGTFAPPVALDAPGASTQVATLQAPDIDGDGADDLVVRVPGGIRVFRSRAGAAGDAFEPPAEIVVDGVRQILTGDFNADGADDVLLTILNNMQILPGAPGGLGAPVIFALPSVNAARGFGVVDLNADGRDDLVVADGASPFVYAYLAQTTLGDFDQVATTALGRLAGLATLDRDLAYASGDVNADGRADFVVADRRFGFPVYVALGDGAGGFTEIRPTGVLPQHTSQLDRVRPALVDFNADRRPDLFFTSAYRGDGVGAFQDLIAPTPTFAAVITLDANADGRPDIAGLYRNGAIGVALNRCDAPLCPADITTEGATPGDPDYREPDGLTTLADFTLYLADWANADPRADIASRADCLTPDPDGVVTLDDFACYLSVWAAGCE